MDPESNRLTLLKVDLGLMQPNANQLTYLNSLLAMAASAIKREGINLLADNLEDDMLVEMYAAWLYRKRANDGNTSFAVGMPRMLRYQLNNKLVSQKMQVTE